MTLIPVDNMESNFFNPSAAGTLSNIPLYVTLRLTRAGLLADKNSPRATSIEGSKFTS
ncbi:MAG: hypothetical protein ACRBBP_00955 [Bdellovibrionales bacterium]